MKNKIDTLIITDISTTNFTTITTQKAEIDDGNTITTSLINIITEYEKL